MIETKDFETGSGSIENYDIINPYIDMLNKKIKINRKLKIAVDCGNATGCLTAPIIFKKVGIKMKIQFKAIKIPPGATHFILFSQNEENPEKEVYSLPFIDKGVPESKPQKIIFEQTSKEGNRVKGKIRTGKITRPFKKK